MSRYFLFGLIEVKEWGYMWGWTAAQIQMMMVDQTITVYKKDDDKKKEESIEEKKERMEQIVANWKKKKASGKSMKLSDFLGAGAKKFDNPITDNNKNKEIQ